MLEATLNFKEYEIFEIKNWATVSPYSRQPYVLRGFKILWLTIVGRFHTPSDNLKFKYGGIHPVE